MVFVFCFSRVSAKFFGGSFFALSQAKPGIPALAARPLPREAKQKSPLPGLFQNQDAGCRDAHVRTLQNFLYICSTEPRVGARLCSFMPSVRIPSTADARRSSPAPPSERGAEQAAGRRTRSQSCVRAYVHGLAARGDAAQRRSASPPPRRRTAGCLRSRARTASARRSASRASGPA